MVKKLREENHNCWGDCEDNAKEMEAAIEEWNLAIKDSGTPVDEQPVDTKVYTAQSKFLSEEFALSNQGIRPNVLNLNLEAAMLNPPMVKVNDMVEGGVYLYVPNDGANATLVNNEPSAGSASINFAVRQTGNYRIWALVDAPNTNDNGFYLNLTTTTSGFREFDVPVTLGFEWRMLQNFTVNLTNNQNHTLQIRQRKDGAKIKKLVVTADNNFNGTTAADFIGVTLTYDIGEQVRVPGVQFKIDVSEYDLYSYKFINPRIVTTSANIKVKSARLLVNNEYNPQHSTFTLIDKVATPTDGKLSDFNMIVIKDKGFSGDKISFSFETLQVDNGMNDDPILAADQEDFRTTVYAVSRASCINCHTTQNPPHAHADYKTAHDVVTTQSLVNFTTTSQSRLVTKVRTNRHNCGTATQCEAIAVQFENAINEWKTRRTP